MAKDKFQRGSWQANTLPGCSTHETEICLAPRWFPLQSMDRSEEPSCTLSRSAVRQQDLLGDHKLLKMCIREKCKRPSTATEAVCGGTKASLTALGLLPASPAAGYPQSSGLPLPPAHSSPFFPRHSLPSHLFLHLLISPAPPGNFLSPF